jgi:hypothetical protein
VEEELAEERYHVHEHVVIDRREKLKESTTPWLNVLGVNFNSGKKRGRNHRLSEAVEE